MENIDLSEILKLKNVLDISKNIIETSIIDDSIRFNSHLQIDTTGYHITKDELNEINVLIKSNMYNKYFQQAIIIFLRKHNDLITDEIKKLIQKDIENIALTICQNEKRKLND